MDNIRDIRKSLNMSQRAFAEALGVTRNYITLIEMGQRSPSRELLESANMLANRTPVSDAPNIDVDNVNLSELAAEVRTISARLSTMEQLLLRLVAEADRRQVAREKDERTGR